MIFLFFGIFLIFLLNTDKSIRFHLIPIKLLAMGLAILHDVQIRRCFSYSETAIRTGKR